MEFTIRKDNEKKSIFAFAFSISVPCTFQIISENKINYFDGKSLARWFYLMWIFSHWEQNTTEASSLASKNTRTIHNENSFFFLPASRYMTIFLRINKSFERAIKFGLSLVFFLFLSVFVVLLLLSYALVQLRFQHK